MDIGNFFQFKGSFQCNREKISTAQVKEIIGMLVKGGDIFKFLIMGQDLSILSGTSVRDFI